MSTPGPQAFPNAALEWLIPTADPDQRLLFVGRTTAPLARRLADSGADLAVADATYRGTRMLLGQAPRAIPAVARPEALPYVPCAFDAILCHQNLHTFALDDTLREFARVLSPGGRIGASWTVRDDSVPWVRRLTALMQAVDPQAMQGDYGTDAAAALEDSPYFTDVERRTARLWVPIARVDLLDMVAQRFPDLEPDRRTALMAEVGALYEASARPPSPLLLPYQVVCWRARVDHSEFTSAIALPDRGLPISL